MSVSDALRQAEGKLSLIGDRIAMLQGKLEDLLFRAQRISGAKKAGMPAQDTMFGYDLQHFRRDIRSFSQEVIALPAMIGAVERLAAFEDGAEKPAQSVMRLCNRVHKAMQLLNDHALLAHTHIREADHKIEAWYLCQEIEEMAQKTQGLPTAANKILIKVAPPA